MFGFSVEQCISALQNAVRVWSFHRETNSACIISYRTMMAQPLASITSIAEYLNLSIDPECLRQIAEEVSFENVKRFSQHVDELNPHRVVRKDGRVFDRETLLHQSHIRNGGIGYGAKSLDKGQLSAIDTMLREEGFAFLCEAVNTPQSSPLRQVPEIRDAALPVR
jgi:hypothetical protein